MILISSPSTNAIWCLLQLLFSLYTVCRSSSLEKCVGHYSALNKPVTYAIMYLCGEVTSAAILYTGAQSAKALSTQMCYYNHTTFFHHQWNYLLPNINFIWGKHQQSLKESNARLIIGCDGRTDSPDHSTKFGSSLMVELCQGSSREGVTRGVTRLRYFVAGDNPSPSGCPEELLDVPHRSIQ